MNEKKIPELTFRFNPTTPGVPPFEVHETINTLMSNNPVTSLIEDNLYYSSSGYTYKLNDQDVLSLLEALNLFNRECILWCNQKLSVAKTRKLKMRILAIGIVTGNLIGWSIVNNKWLIALTTFIIATILAMPSIVQFSYKERKR